MTPRPRLLFVVPDARFFVTHRLPLALAAREAGYDVHVGTPQADPVEEIRAAGLTWHRVRSGPLRQKPWSDLETIVDLFFLYGRLRPALVHHVTFKAVLYGTIAARLRGIGGVVNTIPGLGEVFAAHSVSDRIWRAVIIGLFRAFVRHPRMRVVVQNEEDLRTLIGTRCVAPREAALIPGSGVDPSVFTPVEHRSGGLPTITCTARMVRTKGIGELVAAARILQAAGVRARFVLAGDRDIGNGKAYTDREWEELLTNAPVEYLGWCSDVLALYRETDIVCLPSWGGEGVPKALIEAASCELPIVTTDVPGCRDIVRDGVNGILVPPQSVEPLAAALRTLIDDPGRRRDMGRRGRAIASEEFSMEQVNGATVAVYREVCG